LIYPYLTDLREIDTAKGAVRHCLKSSEDSFAGFGEAYISEVFHGETKGWKMHLEMQINLVVLAGQVKFFLRSKDNDWNVEFKLGGGNYKRLTVPPGFWMAFEGMAQSNIVLNIASIEHDPNEALVADLDRFF
jgi:dTDP-4-dehydrorhamnose 3,5-epimerase